MSPIIARGLLLSPTALLPGPLMLVLPFGAVLYGLAMPGPADPVPKSPSPRLWRMRSVQLAGSAVAGALLAGIGAGLAAGAPAGAAAAAVVAAAVALAAWFVRRRVRAWSYTERDEDLLVSRGVLVRPALRGAVRPDAVRQRDRGTGGARVPAGHGETAHGRGRE